MKALQVIPEPEIITEDQLMKGINEDNWDVIESDNLAKAMSDFNTHIKSLRGQTLTQDDVDELEEIKKGMSGRVAKKVQVTRNGKTFTKTVWVKAGSDVKYNKDAAMKEVDNAVKNKQSQKTVDALKKLSKKDLKNLISEWKTGMENSGMDGSEYAKPLEFAENVYKKYHDKNYKMMSEDKVSGDKKSGEKQISIGKNAKIHNGSLISTSPDAKKGDKVRIKIGKIDVVGTVGDKYGIGDSGRRSIDFSEKDANDLRWELGYKYDTSTGKELSDEEASQVKKIRDKNIKDAEENRKSRKENGIPEYDETIDEMTGSVEDKNYFDLIGHNQSSSKYNKKVKVGDKIFAWKNEKSVGKEVKIGVIHGEKDVDGYYKIKWEKETKKVNA